MIQSILLPLVEGPLAETAKSYAFWLARKESGHIHGLAVVDLKSFEIPVLGTPDGFMPSVVFPPQQESQSLLAEMTALARERLRRTFRGKSVQTLPRKRGHLCKQRQTLLLRWKNNRAHEDIRGTQHSNLTRIQI